MGFIDENGYPLINDEQKIRITLSDRASIIISEDMDIFGISKTASFINTVFHNFKLNAKSSVSLYLMQYKLELEQLFANSPLDSQNQKLAIEQLLSAEKQKILTQISKFNSKKGKGKLYHINDDNITYLLENCDENLYYKRPGLYIRSILEEYCSLPFIERERIYRKEIYDIVECACKEQRVLKIKANYMEKLQTFYVYPYKIVTDPLHTQSYLVCYSRKSEESEQDKIIASFSMTRMQFPTMLIKTFHLNKQEIAHLDFHIASYSPAYLIGKPELIKVKLSEKGKQSYRTRLYSRPEKIQSLSSDNIYVFDCTHHQIINYFLPFGADAEIISPQNLRNLFREKLSKALTNYQ